MAKFNRKRLPKSRNELDEFVRENGLRPYGVIGYKGRDIFLAETELEMDRPLEYPWGYYQGAWFVTSPNSMERFDGGSWGEYEAMHDSDKNWTPETKRQARMNDMLRKAQEWIDKSEEVGRYAS